MTNPDDATEDMRREGDMYEKIEHAWQKLVKKAKVELEWRPLFSLGFRWGYLQHASEEESFQRLLLYGTPIPEAEELFGFDPIRASLEADRESS